MRGALHMRHGLSVVYSPTNVAWLVLWAGREVLAIRSKRSEAIRFAEEHETATDAALAAQCAVEGC